MVKINNNIPVDFIYMSYDEEYADEGFNKLTKIVPNAKRVHGVDGIANAWKKAADICETDYFITMDADAVLNPNFSFEAVDFYNGDQRVHVWRSLNPVNGLIYGYGSIHMFPKALVQKFTNTNVVDFTLNAGTEGVVIQEECATTSNFNRSPKLTWRSAFREASKLASGTNMYIQTNKDWAASEPVTHSRLFIWCSIGMDETYGEYSISGARAGALHGFNNKNNPTRLSDISDYSYLESQFVNNNIKIEVENQLEQYGLIVEDFTESQSKSLKQTWNSINYDVISRLNDKIRK